LDIGRARQTALYLPLKSPTASNAAGRHL